MSQGKQANIISSAQDASILKHLQTTRHPERDAAMFLPSMKAGLRAKEIVQITWTMMTESSSQPSRSHRHKRLFVKRQDVSA